MHAFETTYVCPGQALGAGLATWINTLDHDDDHVLMAILRLETELDDRHADRPPVRTMQLNLMRMRRQIAAAISTTQVLQLDLLIDSPTWSLPELAHWQLDSGYALERIDRRQALLTAG